MTTDEDTLRMLAEVQAANTELAERARAPTWYHPTLGLLMGGLAAIQVAPVPMMFGYYVVFAVGLALLVRAYTRKTGLWVSGYRAGRTRIVAVGLAAITAVLMLGSAWLFHAKQLTWVPLATGALIAVVVTVAGGLWEAAFRRDLRDGGSL